MATNCAYGPHPSQRFDVYAASTPLPGPAPLGVMIHGGGWGSGSKEDVVEFIPNFTSRGFVVATVGYRVASDAFAPAAAVDVRNAIQSIWNRAAEWGAGVDQTVLVGFSAGAHLALLAALAPSAAIEGAQSRAHAIVSFWGITDVADLLEGQHATDFARRWIPEQPGSLDLARKLSPINYDVSLAPPLCVIHSVRDDVVPFAHSERLVMKWKAAGRLVEFIRLSHQGHAAPPGDYPAIFAAIFRFLENAEGRN